MIELKDVAPKSVPELILSRRSIRAGYRDTPVSDDLIKTVMSCGMSAPSSKNSQPWRLHAITDRHLLTQIAEAMRNSATAEGYVPHDPATGSPRPEYRSTVADSADVLGQIPFAVVIESVAPFSRGFDELSEAPGAKLRPALFGLAMEMLGIGAALENMWIAALAGGLQGCFLGDVGAAQERIQQLLACEGDILGALGLGYSDAPPRPPMDQPAKLEVERCVYHLGTG